MTFVTIITFEITSLRNLKYEKNKITFIFNHAAYLVSHRIELIETLIKNGWSVQILFGKGGKIMEKKP